jgi:hypothetical protein
MERIRAVNERCHAVPRRSPGGNDRVGLGVLVKEEPKLKFPLVLGPPHTGPMLKVVGGVLLPKRQLIIYL